MEEEKVEKIEENKDQTFDKKEWIYIMNVLKRYIVDHHETKHINIIDLIYNVMYSRNYTTLHRFDKYEYALIKVAMSYEEYKNKSAGYKLNQIIQWIHDNISLKLQKKYVYYINEP